MLIAGFRMMYSFPKKLRLIKKEQFREVFKTPEKRLTTEAFRIYYCVNDLTYPRLGIVVAKKNFKKAVSRNYFKRIVREFFRLNQNKIGTIDLVVLVNKKAGDLAREELDQQLHKAFR